MYTQKLYVDYAGGKYEYWFYSEGRTFRYSTYDYETILRFKRKNDFTHLILTDEAKLFHRS